MKNELKFAKVSELLDSQAGMGALKPDLVNTTLYCPSPWPRLERVRALRPEGIIHSPDSYNYLALGK